MISTEKYLPTVLMVDDDDADIYLMQRAFKQAHKSIRFVKANNCDDLFDYLHQRNSYADEKVASPPHLILLDINMPAHSGFDLLQMIKQEPNFAHLPVAMLSTSTTNHDVRRAYQLGANAFHAKPSDAVATKRLVEQLCSYWFGVAFIPAD